MTVSHAVIAIEFGVISMSIRKHTDWESLAQVAAGRDRIKVPGGWLRPAPSRSRTCPCMRRASNLFRTRMQDSELGAAMTIYTAEINGRTFLSKLKGSVSR